MSSAKYHEPPILGHVQSLIDDNLGVLLQPVQRIQSQQRHTGNELKHNAKVNYKLEFMPFSGQFVTQRPARAGMLSQ